MALEDIRIVLTRPDDLLVASAPLAGFGVEDGRILAGAAVHRPDPAAAVPGRVDHHSRGRVRRRRCRRFEHPPTRRRGRQRGAAECRGAPGLFRAVSGVCRRAHRAQENLGASGELQGGDLFSRG
jgi:hypothetical protein